MSEEAGTDLLLVSMPWASTTRPSLAIGRLVSVIEAAGFRARASYPSIAFADLLDLESYEVLADTPAFFGMAEHVFAVDIFGRGALKSDALLARAGDAMAGVFASIRDKLVGPFLDQVTNRLVDKNPSVIGFSTTFNQVMPSLAAAYRLRAHGYTGKILLGGACVHGEMGREYRRIAHGVVDDVFLGEADLTLPAYLKALASGADDAELRLIAETESVVSGPVLSDVPPPDYDDWYSERRRHADKGRQVAAVSSLPVEASRGCWWGEKNHCTFCGLNNDGIVYRARTAQSVAREIDYLSRRHRCLSFTAADNILAREHIDELTECLARHELEPDLFFEVKSNLSRREVACLRRMGVKSVQPGIESFSDAVLRTMRKGVKGLTNVRTLRLCKEFGIIPSWNLLGGFAGETAEDYREIARICATIRHLPPPSGNMSIAQVHRFSPFFDEPDKHGIRAVEPCAYYRHWFPEEVADTNRLAYFFEREIPDDSACHAGLPLVNCIVEEWRRAPGDGQMRLGPGFIQWDRTEGGELQRDTLDLPETTAIVLADAVVGERQLRRRLRQRGFPPETVDHVLDRGLIIESGGAVVSIFPFDRPVIAENLQSWLDRFAPVTEQEAALAS